MRQKEQRASRRGREGRLVVQTHKRMKQQLLRSKTTFPIIPCSLVCYSRLRREGYTVQVSVNDYLDIYCPHYNATPRGTLERTVAEQYVLYMVSYRGYRMCDPQQGFKRWECNRPHAPHAPIKFSEKFQRYSAFSLGYEFNVGQEYYYICESNVEL
ncbi:Ephrin-A3 EFL-2 EHK1 ligand [Takifugu flavidus]|uniref:Ephrin-A3 EFL-2 EHK1 ligand n=1 Tax=Takifugu flavidus TaxID=433684 RepID=A0A5C6NG86_9TELE|nr:Ephrin-A3 EFL-2 EHK1 ligand [Takifugu flavidus]